MSFIRIGMSDSQAKQMTQGPSPDDEKYHVYPTGIISNLPDLSFDLSKVRTPVPCHLPPNGTVPQ